MTPPRYALKLVRDDYGSLTQQHVRVIYAPGTVVTAPGNGIYAAVTGGGESGGVGAHLPLLSDLTGPPGAPCAESQPRRDALYAEHQTRWAELIAEYRPRRAALYAEYRLRRAALDAEYRLRWGALFTDLVSAVVRATGGAS